MDLHNISMYLTTTYIPGFVSGDLAYFPNGTSTIYGEPIGWIHPAGAWRRQAIVLAAEMREDMAQEAGRAHFGGNSMGNHAKP
jgi:hypothetical protein